MKKLLQQTGSVLVTGLALAAALVVGRHIWAYYNEAPWTRDGHVRADLVQVAPDVSGLLTEVRVHDNQHVRAGELLMVVDPQRYQLAAGQAAAAVQLQQAQLAQLRAEARRNLGLADIMAQESREQADSKVAQAEAALAGAQAALRLARLNLERTRITSPVEGYVSDRTPRAGDYVQVGRPVLSVIDAASFHVDGYFEETKLDRVQPDQAVEIRVMGYPGVLHGHVQSIAAAIEDRDRSNGANLLPNVNPTFNWVRLAQRIPVRIALDERPESLRLIAGRTATVSILTDGHKEPAGRPGGQS
ncbi:MAG: HlyD family secretion protein [Curvibacter sp.]|nr:HlyD family secretion protein [Curvibacter sp.]